MALPGTRFLKNKREPGWFPLIGGSAAPTRLLSFRYIDGLCFRRDFSSPRIGVIKVKVMAGGTPANPATMEKR
jgi:hypothetical protein